uniref:Putative josephin-like protein n=1 Tax=Davidia involucrata TaxID=16924 RepID=A0A5B7BS39_DAVIN
MSTRGSGRVSSRPNTDDKTTVFHKQNSGNRVSRNSTTKRFTGNCRLRLPRRSELSPVRFLKRLGHKVVVALHLVSKRRRSSSSPKVSSSGKSKPFVAPIDSHRAEAIDDCIEFINSSSSLQRSNSVSAINQC